MCLHDCVFRGDPVPELPHVLPSEAGYKLRIFIARDNYRSIILYIGEKGNKNRSLKRQFSLLPREEDFSFTTAPRENV